MKKIISLSVVLLILACSNRDKSSDKVVGEETKAKYDWKEKKLKDRIKTITETVYNIALIGSIDEVMSGKGEVKKGDKQLSSTITVFDERGNIIEETEAKDIISLSGAITGKSQNKKKYTYKYDTSGNRVEKSIYHAEGTLWFTYYYKYDDKGNQIESAPDENTLTKNIYKHDDKGSLIEDIYILNGKQWSKKVFKYDLKGNIIEMQLFPDIEKGTPSSITIYKYDDEGNEVETESHSPEGEIFIKYSYKYKYDKKKNWVIKIESINDKPNSFIEREIKYF